MEKENMQDLYDAMLEAQEADMEARGMMDAPDSLQIAGITEEELEAGIDEDELPENELTDADWDAWADEYEERKNDLAN
jgi:hypothetical protein